MLIKSVYLKINLKKNNKSLDKVSIFKKVVPKKMGHIMFTIIVKDFKN